MLETIRIQFMVREHEEFGTLGFAPKGAADADPLGGMGMAHDVFEHAHLPGIGGVADEFHALGAMLYVRGEEYFHAKGQHTTCPGQNAAADFGDILGHVIHEGKPFDHPGATTPCEDHVEEWINTAILSGFSECRERDLQLETGWGDAVRGWMRRGYQHAEARYGHRGTAEVGYAFAQLESWGDDFLAEEHRGATVTVEVDVETLRGSARAVYSWGDEDVVEELCRLSF
jgi:hypothetical protein